MKHSTGKPTKAEQARFEKMKEQGICMACYQQGIENPFRFYDMDTGIFRPRIEIHHLLSGNKRIGHMATVSLCPWHHRAVCLDGYGNNVIRNLDVGESLAYGSKPFHAQFGSDAELLAMQNEMLHEP